jgi:putative membrane-bound dehydrogenase-like protein
MMLIRTSAIALVLLICPAFRAEEKKPIKLLFLGDHCHHHPAARFHQLEPVLAKRGIEITYTDKVADLNPQVLDGYDGLIVYANITKIAPEEEKALLDFVEGGKGFIPLHCASYCFLNSPRYIALVGAQFLRHGTGTFRTTIAQPDHPVMKGFKGFESWDETYVHTKHNEKNRTVLEYREDRNGREPWTWVRTQGKGRVFYTAWGHDEPTWGNPGFQNLVERGIRWAVGRDPSVVPPFSVSGRMARPESSKGVAAGTTPSEDSGRGTQPGQSALTDLLQTVAPKRTDVKPFEYAEARVPFYPAGRQWGTTGEPFHLMQKPLDPDESMEHFVTPVGFEVQLFASEPDLGGKPISMNWDERGRLWVCVTVDYPNNKQPPGQGHDRIVICEDTKGTGRADKFTVFADKISLPTSLTFYRGGVIVHEPPQTLYLKDTNGDDVADERRVLFTGWSTEDTHAGPSNLHYGLDNWIYGIDGYSGFNGTVGGEKHRFSQGFYRFRPDGSRMEFLRNTNNNSWGLGFSEEGILFGSTANGNPSVHLPIPNRYYERVRGWSSTVLFGIAGNPAFAPITDKVRQVDYHGHFTAAAGHELYTARAYPPEFWNRAAFVAEPTGHLLATFELEPRGATFRSRMVGNLLASDDEWSAPVFGAVGPDGQVWVIDWYNYIVQHNPTPAGWKTGKGNAYETELRDKKHGRIYRVVYRGGVIGESSVVSGKETPGTEHSPLAIHHSPSGFSLQNATPEKLLATLKNDNLFWRLQAQRLLVERGRLDVVPALIKLAGDRGTDAIGLNPGVIHALWTLQGLGALDGLHADATVASVAALGHPSAGVRRNAIQVLPPGADSVAALIRAGSLQDPDVQVRLAGLLALADRPVSPGAAEAIVTTLGEGSALRDRWLTDAATSAAAANAEGFLAAALAHQWESPVTPALVNLVDHVAEHYARGGPAETAGKMLAGLDSAQEPIGVAVLAGLSRGWPRDRTLPASAETDERLTKLFGHLSPRGQGYLIELASRWGSRALDKEAAEIATALLTRVGDEKASDRDRARAATQLVEVRRIDGDIVHRLLEMITPRTSPELARDMLEAIAHSDATGVGAELVGRLPSLTPGVRAAGLRVVLGKADWTQALLDAAVAGKFKLSELTLDQRQALLSHPRRGIAGRARRLLARSAGLPNPDRQKVVDELMPLTEQKGDAAAGKLVFKNNCAICHTHDGEGGKVGPDLTGMAVHPKSYLLAEILDPSRNVEANYRQYVVSTSSGRVLSGLLASETKTSVELIDAQGKRHTILREDIEDLQTSSKSLMPEGFEKQLSKNDLANLLEFLTHKGKYLPLPLGPAATAVSTRGMFYSPDDRVERLVFDDWSPHVFHGIPFTLVDPLGDRAPNVILLYGPEGSFPPRMPRSVTLPCNTAAKAIHLLSGVSGWGFPLGQKGSVSLIVRLRYEDGKTEEHPLRNGVHFADYIRRVDVPGSQFAFGLHGRQVRYLAVEPGRREKIRQIEFVKGPDDTAPVIMAVTVETD